MLQLARILPKCREIGHVKFVFKLYLIRRVIVFEFNAKVIFMAQLAITNGQF